MRIADMYAHRDAYRILKSEYADAWQDIQMAIAGVDADECRTKESKETSRESEMLLSPTNMKRAVNEELGHLGWRSRRRGFDLPVFNWADKGIKDSPPEILQSNADSDKGTRIRTVISVGLVKDGVAAEVQFGKYTFIAYDIHVKHESLRRQGITKLLVEMVASKSMLGNMSSGPGYFERAAYDLSLSNNQHPEFPVLLVGLDE